MKRIICSILTLMCFSLLAGCSGKTTVSFMREDVTLDFVNRICVFPLENNTDQKYAAELARDVINTQILAMNIFDVVDKGIVDSVLHEEAIDPGSPVSQLMLSRLGQRLNVQSIMIGSVDMAGDKRVGSVIVPEMSLTLRLIEIKSGIVLWQASGHYAGDSVMGRLFGITPDDTYKVTVKLVKGLLSTIPERQNVPMPAAPVAVQPVVVKPVSVVTDVPQPEAVEESVPVEPEAVEVESAPAEDIDVEVTPSVSEEPVPAEPVVEAQPPAVDSMTSEPVDVEIEQADVVVEPVATEEAAPPAAEEAVSPEPVMEPAPEAVESVTAEPVIEVEPAVTEPDVEVEPAPDDEAVAVETEPPVADPVPAEPVMQPVPGESVTVQP